MEQRRGPRSVKPVSRHSQPEELLWGAYRDIDRYRRAVPADVGKRSPGCAFKRSVSLQLIVWASRPVCTSRGWES